MAKQKKVSKDPIAKELESIKRLLMMQLVASGIEARHIAKALEIDQSIISRMIPVRVIKQQSDN